MSENRILELLSRKLANEATDAELRELQRLLMQHPDGVYYEELFSQLWSLNTENDADIEAAYHQHSAKYPDIKNAKRKINWAKPLLLLGAACMLLLLSSLFLWVKFHTDIDNIPYTQIFAGKGIRKAVKLPDGTKVWLNSNSKLRFADDISHLTTGRVRRVILEGEAFFDVAKDKQHPFVISTGTFAIRVLGTAFNVKAYRGDCQSEAVLIHGSIELTLAGDEKHKLLLKPNEKFILAVSKATGQASGSRSISIQHVKPIAIQNQQVLEETAWKYNKLVFNDEPFSELVPKLERWFNITIHVKNPSIYQERYTGAFQTESPEQALKAMQIINPFKYEIKNNEVTIY
jgi:transmembrane sensor